MDQEKVLKDILDKVAKEQKYENYDINFKQISSDGANYTSLIYLATITAPDKDDLKLFVKVAAIGDKMRSVASSNIFEVESFFYKKLLGIYKDLEERHMVPPEHRLVTAKFYAANDECYKEAVVLEDLTVAGYQSYDRFQCYTWEYAKSGVQNLAKLHALSIAWSISDPKAFEESAEKLKSEQNVEPIMEYFQNVVKNAIEVTKEENKERFIKFVEKYSKESGFGMWQKPLRRPVVAYGDYRPSNLMHKEREDGTIEIISVDYQTLQIGNPILDIMYFIYCGSDKEYRKNYFKQTLEFYYSELRAALERLDVVPDDVYPREDFDYEVEQTLPFGLVLSIFCLLIITVKAEDAPTVNQDTAITDFGTSPNQLYKERLNDIIDDFIDMGIL